MQTIKSKLRVWLTAVCAVLFIIAMSFGLAACGTKELKIDVPERIKEDLGTGTYVVPRYEVVNQNGVIMAGYTVRLKSVTDPNGEAAEISREASTIVTLIGAGEYTFVYTADSSKVADATVIMDFADRTAPTINLASSQFPAFFIKNVTYAVPEYTLEGDFVASKCYTKVFYNDGQGDDAEVTLSDGSFLVEHDSGKYTVLIHVEDAAGNYNDYRYARSVYSPEHYEEDIVVYFNEAFGEKQVAADGNYAGAFVSAADGGKAYGDEAGSYKVEFSGAETTNNEAYFAINVPAIANIMAYKELEMYVYIEDEDCPNEKTQWIVGSKWWNDTAVKAGEWTRVTWSVENWGNGTGANSGATTVNVISTDNISGTRIRLIPDADYNGKTPPHGTVYFSAMRAVPYEMSQITAGDNVTLDKRDGSYRIGDTAVLTAQKIEGKTFDCFLVDGKPIGGNTFVVEKAAYAVEAKYVDGALTVENMTWGTTESYRTEGSDAKKQTLGTGTHWVLTYEPEFAETGWVYTAAYVGGNDQLFGIEMHSDNDSRKLSGYGGAWKGDVALPVSEAVRDALRNSKTQPVTMVYVRNGETISVYLQQGEEITFLGSVAFSVFSVSGNDFGIGERAGDIQNAAIQNIKWIVGEEKTGLYLETLTVGLTLTDAAADKDGYYLGETVTLTAAPAPAGQAFAYFTVDGEPIEGNTLVLTKFSYEIVAVYAEISKLELGDGIETADGKTTVGKGATVTLVFHGVSPADKYFNGFTVDGTPIEGNTFVTTQSSHSVAAVFADRIANDNVALNDIGKATETGGVVYHATQGGWRPAAVEYVTDFGYDGVNGAVDANNSLKVTLSGGEQSFALNNGASDLSGYKELYFYVYTEASGLKAGGWWCGDTELTAGVWTKVSFGRDLAPTTIADVSVWTNGLSQFAYRIMNGQAGTVVYVTAIYGVPYADVQVTVDESVSEYVTVSGTFKEGQSVTFSVDGAPAGKRFAYFTVNGGRCDGATYTLGTENITVSAVFTEISVLTLGNGISTADSETEYARGVTVTLSFDESNTPNGKLFDYFTVDGNRIAGNTFETTAAAHEVGVQFADSAAGLTWVTGEEAAGSDVTYSWSNSAYTFNGKAVGESEHWAIEAQAYGFDGLGSKWYSLDFLVGNNASLQIRLHSADNANIQAMGANHGDGTTLISLDASVIDLCKAATEAAPVTFTAIRNGGTYYVLINGTLVLKTQFAFNVSGNRFGIGGTDCGTWLTAHPTSTYEYRTGEALAEYLTTVNVSGTKASFDKADGVYKLGDTVTLTHDAAEQGYAFSYYTLDGNRLEGDSFVATKKDHAVVAVFSEISTLTLGNGISTADGETVYARGVTVTLIYNGTPDAGYVFDCFKVDGKAISGNSFVTSAASHSIEVVLVNAAEDMTWATVDSYQTEGSDAKKQKLSGGEYWVLTYTAQLPATGWSYVGAYIGGNDQLFGIELHSDNDTRKLSGYGGAWKGMDAITLSVAARDMLRNSETNPVTMIYIRNGNVISVYLRQGETTLFLGSREFSVFEVTGNDFGIGERNGPVNATLSDIEYVIGEGKVGLYIQSLKTSITFTKASATESKDYYIGDTVTLTHDAAEQGYAFSYYTLDGNRLEGDSFVVTKANHTVEAVYDDLTNTYYIDVAPADTVFMENGRLTLPVAVVKDGNGDIVSGYTVTATVIDAKGNTCTVVDGVAEIGYNGAVALEITYSCEALSGKDRTITVMAQGKDGTVLEANAFGASLVSPDSAYATVEYSTEQVCDIVGDGGSVKITVSAAKGNQDYAYFKFDFAGYDYIEFYAYTAGTGKQIGGWWYGDTTLTANTWTKVRLALHSSNVDSTNGWRIRLMNVSAGDTVYLSSMKLCKFDYNQPVLDVSKGATKGEWTTEKAYDGDDPLVDKTGSLKLTPDSDDYYSIKVNAEGINVWDIVDNYSEVYFYVYTDAAGAKGSVEWAADTELTAGQWTKVTVTSDKFANLTGAGTSMSQFSYRIMSGNGGVFYVTSLYGVPKTAE